MARCLHLIQSRLDAGTGADEVTVPGLRSVSFQVSMSGLMSYVLGTQGSHFSGNSVVFLKYSQSCHWGSY